MDKIHKLRRLYKEANIIPKKYNTENGKTVIVLPSPIQKKDLTDYTYGKNIDEKVIKMASSLAEKMAVAIVRETLSLNIEGIVDKICDKIVPKLVDRIGDEMNSTLPESIAGHYMPIAKDEIRKEIKEFVFERPDIAIDRSQGIKVKGEVGNKTTSSDSTDNDLDLLDNLL